MMREKRRCGAGWGDDILGLDRTEWWPAGAAPCVARQAVATVAQFARPRPFETRTARASGAICRS
ncbi:hypothetical protein GD429_01260 [Burkholderia sp. BE17]|nr:hypothetical protein [Burkholderia sp. BE17]